MKYIATSFNNQTIFLALEKEFTSVLSKELAAQNLETFKILGEIGSLCSMLICRDLLSPPFSKSCVCSGTVASIILNENHLNVCDAVTLEIYRPSEYSEFCAFHLSPDKHIDLSIQNLTRFMEMGGLSKLQNKVRLAG